MNHCSVQWCLQQLIKYFSWLTKTSRCLTKFRFISQLIRFTTEMISNESLLLCSAYLFTGKKLNITFFKRRTLECKLSAGTKLTDYVIAYDIREQSEMTWGGFIWVTQGARRARNFASAVARSWPVGCWMLAGCDWNRADASKDESTAPQRNS